MAKIKNCNVLEFFSKINSFLNPELCDEFFASKFLFTVLFPRKCAGLFFCLFLHWKTDKMKNSKASIVSKRASREMPVILQTFVTFFWLFYSLTLLKEKIEARLRFLWYFTVIFCIQKGNYSLNFQVFSNKFFHCKNSLNYLIRVLFCSAIF